MRWRCLTSNGSFNFGADPDHDPDPEFLREIFTAAGYYYYIVEIVHEVHLTN